MDTWEDCREECINEEKCSYFRFKVSFVVTFCFKANKHENYFRIIKILVKENVQLFKWLRKLDRVGFLDPSFVEQMVINNELMKKNQKPVVLTIM